MSVTISSGGGGGITIETDPTALKIASNLADLSNTEDARNNLLAIGLLSDAPNDGTVYGRQSGEWVAAGGGGGGSSFSVTGQSPVDGFQSTVKIDATQINGDTTSGATLGEVVVSHNTLQGTNDHVKIACFDADGYGYRSVGLEGYTVINEGTYAASFKFGNYADANNGNGSFGWKVDPMLIFPDGTIQTTAYTSGGGTANQQRLADAIAALVATPTTSQGEFGCTINLQWAFTTVYNNNALWYEYPKFIDLMSGYGYPNTYSYTPYALVANEFFGLSYVDYNGMVFNSFNILGSFVDAITIVVTDNVSGGGFTDSTTTAYSFPCAIASYYPV